MSVESGYSPDIDIQKDAKTMNKLIMDFLADPCAKTAQRLARHADKHPMAICMLDRDAMAAVAQAQSMARGQ